MRVAGLGNVVQVNNVYIFISEDDKQSKVRATPELLRLVKETAVEAWVFYGRMWEEITAEYEKRKVEVEKKYQFITSEMVEEAFTRGHREGMELSCRKDSNNEECIRQYSSLHGLYEGANLASGKRWEAHRLQVQAEDALTRI